MENKKVNNMRDTRFKFLDNMSRDELEKYTILCRKSIMLHDARVNELNKEIDKLSRENLELQIKYEKCEESRKFVTKDYLELAKELGVMREVHGYYDEVKAQGEDFF